MIRLCQIAVLLGIAGISVVGAAQNSATAPVVPEGVSAGAVVRSTGAERVSVSVHRATQQDLDEPLNINNLQGYALISEQRTVTLPAGRATIRFEGVSPGMVAVSAAVTGLPGGTVQKNRDYNLLTPASLVDGTLGNRVTLRRTIRATGETREESAIIRSASAQALVLETPTGVEALRCSGLPETLRFNRLPDGLTDSPILSVETDSPAATTATVTLTYLSSDFDWKADYVAIIPGEGRDRMTMFGWMTVGNGNALAFDNVTLTGVVGDVNYEEAANTEARDPWADRLSLSCYPLGTTSTVFAPPPPPPPPSPAPTGYYGGAEDIVVTGSRIAREQNMSAISVVTAEQERLGNLHLFRVPFTTALAARNQKQVAFMSRNDIPFTREYRIDTDIGNAGDYDEEDGPPAFNLRLKFRNDRRSNLGLPLSRGSVALYQEDGTRVGLAGIIRTQDAAEGQEFMFDMGPSQDIFLTSREEDSGDRTEAVFTASNATNSPVTVTVRFTGDTTEDSDWRLISHGGGRVVDERNEDNWTRIWTVTLPANGTRTIRFREVD